MRRAFQIGVTLLVGAVTGFLLAGPVVFADGAMGERAATLGLAAVVYLVLGALAGWWLRTWRAGVWLAAPGLIVALALGEAWAVISATMGVVLISALVGAWLGTRVADGRRAGRT